MSNTKEGQSVDPNPAEPRQGSQTDTEQTLEGETQESPSQPPANN